MLLLLTAGCFLMGCSTKKNTASTRFYHATTAHYNTFYNGQLAFIDGEEAQTKGHTDNYTEVLPVEIVANKNTAALGKSNYETTIEKCQKAIKKHSIKKKPKKPKGKMSAKQKAFAARHEFNPYLKHVWLTFADAQFRKGEFIEAAASYNYIIRLYETQPDIVCIARARLARCYVLLDWPYDAEDVFNKIGRDSIPHKAKHELALAKASYYVSTGQYAQAIEPLKLTIHHSKKRQKARLYYLEGQLYQLLGDKAQAYSAFKKCTHQNPPYELDFNARIAQTEVMAEGQGRKMIKKLKRMAKNPNNADYLDRIYYAIGNIYLADKDTLRTTYAWKKGIEESTKGGFAKAVVCEHLGELYWEMENYIDAAWCYSQLVSLIDKERPDYDSIEARSKMLTEIEPHLSAVKLQDSLQVLATLPEAEYLAAIDRVIADLKKKEKEQAKREDTQAANAARQQQATQMQQASSAKAGSNRGAQQTTFYFYNTQTVATGKQTFQKRWGNRGNVDNWQFSELLTQAAQNAQNAAADGTTPNDSIGEIDWGEANSEESLSDEEQALKDSLANDPHEREYYIRQIPFTDEQKQASDALILDGLYNSGILEMEKIENFDLAEKTLLRLIKQFPEFEKMDDVYYHLFLLALRNGDEQAQETYKQLLCDSFPDSKLTVTISNPRFKEIARYGRHMEDTLYVQTYEAYQASDYASVNTHFDVSTSDFPEGDHRGKFLFIHAMSQLYLGNRDSFLVELKRVVQDYSKDEVSEMASAIVKGIDEGRLLVSDKWDNTDIWHRRAFGYENDSTATQDTLSDDLLQPYVFVLAYPTGELDENQLLFEVARFNFSTFMARNFDIEIVPAGMITQMQIKGFTSYDEVHTYAQMLLRDTRMNQRLEGIRKFLISEANLKLLGTRYSYEDYIQFYNSKLSPVKTPDDLDLDAPESFGPTDIDDVLESEESKYNGQGAKEKGQGTNDQGQGSDDDWMP